MALEVVRRVAEEGAYSTIALSAALERSGLGERDRRLAADLAYGTLRRLLFLDRALALASGRAPDALEPEARALLRLGAYQLLFTRVPPHAAVAETVALAPLRFRGLANAVLRRLAADPPRPPAGDDDEAVALRTGLAPWAVAELRRLLPPDRVEEAARALAEPAELCLRVNTCRVAVEEVERALQQAGHRPRRGRHPSVLRVDSVAPARLPGYAEGWFTVQDEASVLVGEAVGAGPGDRVLDACAAPGGKATHLACLVSPGGLVVAGDVHPRRAALVARAAERLGVRVAVLAQDARRPAVRGPFDAALVDAPCSGLGAARRRPELLWRPARERLSQLARLQVAILVVTADLVRPGGRLVYAVCTFPRAETEAAARAFLAKRPDFEPAALPGPDGPAPAHRLWPHVHGTDAMFYAGFRRRPA
ncbi:MAG TPA: transcription antitermination factor NusB [Actinomycetota bacterium]|nr:transcription antitermination factor NusB [Actinomycetota bacterium]